MADTEVSPPGIVEKDSLASSPLPSSTSPRYLNNGYQDDSENELRVNNHPSSSRRLPPLELEPKKPPRHKSKSPRFARQQNINDEEANDSSGFVASPKRYKKKLSKNRSTSAESGTTLNSPEIVVSSELDSDRNGYLNERSPMPSPRIFKVNAPERDSSVRPKDPGRQIKVVAEIEQPSSEVVMHQSDRIVSRSKSFTDDNKTMLTPQPLHDSISKSHSSSALYQIDGKEFEGDTIDIVSTNLSASFTKAPGHSILKHSPDSGSHVVDMFRAGSRPNSASSSKPSVRIDDQVTYADESVLPMSKKTKKSPRPHSAKRYRPKSARNSQKNGTANGVNHNGSNNNKLQQTTQRKISPHMKTSIFTTIFCGFFAGAAALYFSLRARKALKEGDEKLGAKYAFYSKLFNGLGIGLVIFIAIILVVYYNISFTKNLTNS